MSTGFTVMGDEHLVRANLWSRELNELWLDDLHGMRWVKLITDFPDGTTINYPSIGEAETADFSEGQAIRYSALDTGNFTFAFDQYKYAAHSISEKFKRDSYYAQEVLSAFIPRQHRALMEAVETRIFERMNSDQTAANVNAINGANHRWVGSGTNEAIALKDFAMARYSLKKANVPLNNLVACVDPSVAYSTSSSTSRSRPKASSTRCVTKNTLTRFSSRAFTICRAISEPSLSLVAAKDSSTKGLS